MLFIYSLSILLIPVVSVLVEMFEHRVDLSHADLLERGLGLPNGDLIAGRR